MRWPITSLLFTLVFAAVANAQSEKVIKVLPVFLDAKGRAALSPSLFDRDAYQEKLRAEPEKRAGLRFDVQWKASYFPALKLRLEARGVKGRATSHVEVLEREIKPGTLSQWTALTITGEEYQNFGELLSWRATILNGTNVLAQQKSFLW